MVCDAVMAVYCNRPSSKFVGTMFECSISLIFCDSYVYFKKTLVSINDSFELIWCVPCVFVLNLW